MNRFIAKNRWFSYLLLGVLLLIIWASFADGVFELWFAVILTASLAVCCLLLPLSAANILLQKAIDRLEHECDPHSLLMEIEDQLCYVRSSTHRQLIIIDYAAALIDCGKFSEAKERLESVDINLLAATPLEHKALYYANLSCACLGLDEFETAEAYREKSAQILQLAKNKKLKNKIFASLRFNAAEYSALCKSYDTALALLETIPDTSKRISVEKAFLYGQIFLAQEKTEEAHSNFAFAAANGGGLYIAQRARQLLEASNKQ